MTYGRLALQTKSSPGTKKTGVNTIPAILADSLSGERPEIRWNSDIDKLEEALLYISQHAKAKDALNKITGDFKTLQENMTRLVGTVYIGGGTPNKYDEPADVIHTLNRDGFNWRLSDWNGKWLYTESGELVSHKAISKHDLNKALYGKVSSIQICTTFWALRKGKLTSMRPL